MMISNKQRGHFLFYSEIRGDPAMWRKRETTETFSLTVASVGYYMWANCINCKSGDAMNQCM
jgi:hypothetical protein